MVFRKHDLVTFPLILEIFDVFETILNWKIKTTLAQYSNIEELPAFYVKKTPYFCNKLISSSSLSYIFDQNSGDTIELIIKWTVLYHTYYS